MRLLTISLLGILAAAPAEGAPIARETTLVPLALAVSADRAAKVKAAAKPAPAKALIGDPVKGEKRYEDKCGGCHALDANRVGPMHRGVYGRKAGSVPGFAYSRALKKSKVVWGDETLDKWLTNPEALIPGQRMNYRLSDAGMRADIIAYLKLESAPAAPAPIKGK